MKASGVFYGILSASEYVRFTWSSLQTGVRSNYIYSMVSNDNNGMRKAQ